MKKNIVFLFLLFSFSAYCFSQTSGNVNVTIDVTNVAVNGGKVYLAIFATAEEFKKEQPFIAVDLGDKNTTLSQEVTLPAGEYVVSAFQDANDNGTCDFGLFGIPKELVGISNYFGKGFPSRDFNKQKIKIDSTTGKVAIGLYKF